MAEEGAQRMAPTVDLPAPYVTVDEYLVALVAFLEAHAWLFRCHVVDFVTLDHWQHMPEAWREPLLDCSTAELLCLPVGICPSRAEGVGGDAGWPASLAEFIRGASALALPRVPALDNPAAGNSAAAASGTAADLEGLGSEPGMELACHANSTPLEKALSRGMKAKKRHEVERLGALVSSLCRRLNCKTVVDFGSGQGYLGQILHFGYGLRVVAIDSSSHQTHGADRRVQRVKKALIRRPTAPAATTLAAVDRAAQALFQPEPAPDADASAAVPEVLVPADAVCNGCGISAAVGGSAALKPCTLCGEVFYCSKMCQKLGWKKLKHKVHCKGMASHRAVAAAEKAATQVAAAAAAAEADALGPDGPGVHSVTCLLDQKLTTLPSLLQEQPAAVAPVAATAREDEDDQTGGGFVLLGLHTCGDLTPSMLRVFGNGKAWSPDSESDGKGKGKAAWGQPAAIVNVGCCYHLLTEGDNQGKVSSGGVAEDVAGAAVTGGLSGEDGFPLSGRVARLGLQLGLGARMLACQAVERWPTKGELEQVVAGGATVSGSAAGGGSGGELGEADMMFRKHFYRGVLQCVLEERYAEQRPQAAPAHKVNMWRGGEGADGGLVGGGGGPPPEALAQDNRKAGWRVGAQKKNTAARTGQQDETATDTEQQTVTLGGRASETQSGGEVVANAVPASQRHEHKEADNRGGGKSWDQAVNSKVRGGSFAEYAAAALARLDLASYQPLPPDELADYEERHVHRRQEIAVFWTIRAVLAPLIEGLLLLDRTLYLHEECQCASTALLPLFDPEISPRSFVVVGTKPKPAHAPAHAPASPPAAAPAAAPAPAPLGAGAQVAPRIARGGGRWRWYDVPNWRGEA